MESSWSFWGLIRHCWNLIWRWSFSDGRVSRGEYWISWLLLSLLLSIATFALRGLVFGLWFISEWAVVQVLLTLIVLLIGVILPLIAGIYQIKFIIKRSHDLDKSGWYIYIPLLGLLISLVIGGARARFNGLSDAFISRDLAKIQSSVANPVIGIVALLSVIFVVRAIARGIVLGFFRWTKWDNQYGPDPLANNLSTTWLCRWVALSLLILNIIMSSLSAALQLTLVGGDEDNQIESITATSDQNIEENTVNLMMDDPTIDPSK
jgi:uncharacterized membrane protein YhaH (DUF805 family)